MNQCIHSRDIGRYHSLLFKMSSHISDYSNHIITWLHYIDDIFMIWEGPVKLHNDFFKFIKNNTYNLSFTMFYDRKKIIHFFGCWDGGHTRWNVAEQSFIERQATPSWEQITFILTLFWTPFPILNIFDLDATVKVISSSNRWLMSFALICLNRDTQNPVKNSVC